MVPLQSSMYPFVDDVDPFFNDVDPFADVTDMDTVCGYDPVTEFGIAAFIHEFFTGPVPSKVILRDPVGNEFEVGIRFVGGLLQMCEGWKKLGPYYNLDDFGGWIYLTYQDDSTFLMRIKDRFYRNISYPEPAMYFGLSSSV